MSKSTRFLLSSFAIPFIISLVITLTVYILRGMRILGFLPGGVVLILIAVSIILGILYTRQATRRF
ncbi:hypothetical protein PCC8801_0793 [Rippkaea orientalis PCC 8801]|uniref:Uncharacterized protein n=1 Tax=Rippkaea orientalis (strain PCC 8801 / RF-1) TaxID=41431 RepID=B7JYK5_RIPO1|nr:hypothetical protein [Rippkaea orientalis]ACK64875.1 hypothetical protein PCC8801_0793 [Rippkaea orientalis PCC 8801]